MEQVLKYRWHADWSKNKFSKIFISSRDKPKPKIFRDFMPINPKFVDKLGSNIVNIFFTSSTAGSSLFWLVFS